MRLQRRTALVTGATAGIGLATAKALAMEGADVILTGRRQDRLDEQVAALAAAGHTARGLCFDVRDGLPAGVGPVDILVNNAGLARGTDALQHGNPDDWQEMMDTNVMGLLRVTRPVAQAMAARGSGHIVNLGSVAGRWVYPGGGVYCATKHAVGALTEGLRLDLHGTGIRVSNIEPGLVETEFSLVRFRGDEAKADAVYADTTPLQPQDVAEAIVWTVTRPAHVNVQEMVLYPTDQASVRDVVRSSK